MLAALGWPLAEQLHPLISKSQGLPSLLTKGGLDPSVLNGGLSTINPVFWGGFALLGVATES
jgi:hypothetical protein